MKNILFTIFFIAAQAYITSANAQNGDLKNASDELLKIKQEKLDIDSNLKKQEAVCYKKFVKLFMMLLKNNHLRLPEVVV